VTATRSIGLLPHFAGRDADQNQPEFEEFSAAIRSGRLDARAGV
jgi:hypothetical protein